MSGFINKALVSTTVGMIFGDNSQDKLQMNSAALVITYMSLCAKDFYDFCKGDIVTVTRKGENGQSVEKKFEHSGFDAVKCSVSLFGFCGIISFDSDLPLLGITFLSAAAICDIFNLESKYECYQEINGNDSFIITPQ